MWKELEERYGQSTPLPVARCRFFQCRQWPGVPLFDYQLNLHELHSRWREEEPSGEAGDDTLLRDQFLLGLDDGPVKQELQRQVRCQDSLTFRQVTTEARVLERELRGEGPASQTPAASLATREPPVRPEVDLEQWKEDIKRELRQELQDQLTALGRTLVAELRQQCAPGPVAPSSRGTKARGTDNNHLYAPLSDQHSFPYRWDERGGPICHKCGGTGHNRPPIPEQLSSVRLTRRDPVQVPVHSEMVRWAQVSGGGLAEGQCGLVEGVEDGNGWKVARRLVRVRGGGVLLRIAKAHPFPIELHRRRPLATIASIDPSRVQGGGNMVLQTPRPGEVIIDVRTTQAPAGTESPLDLPEAEGLMPD
ncbi:hypothetical protein SKAU_G00192050 [Synaphobranchus kaupii]|uniref:Uncharacterized protein n=1 Tax=Synaphobranchus kaupii TaxID=118154 RepID=A0A9Q1IWY8_SYNKA|nr:hypothetical protein SKAU_G00192050 [Synaphobranchus kaupii]